MTEALLWRVTSPQGFDSFLFGTMHVRDALAFGNMPLIKSCINRSEVYYSELEMESKGLGSLAELQRMPRGQELTDIMSFHHYSRLRRIIFRAFGVDIHPLRHFYPMIVANIIQTSVLQKTSDEILDYYLYQYARDQGKEMRYLESQRKQLAIFQQIPIAYQVKALRQLGKQPAKAKKQIRALVSDYSARNTRQLYQRSKNQLGKLRHVLLYQRNEQMSEKLSLELMNTSAFVGVGAAHLFGYKGILRLMKKNGFVVRSW